MTPSPHIADITRCIHSIGLKLQHTHNTTCIEWAEVSTCLAAYIAFAKLCPMFQKFVIADGLFDPARSYDLAGGRNQQIVFSA